MLLQSAAAVLALAAPAWANDSVTINHSQGYADLSLVVPFVTVPTLCDEPIGSQGTSAIACSPLGDAAIKAIQGMGTGTDVYWEPAGMFLTSTNAFVPSNPGPIFGPSGFFPIFSQHKYDLFGRAEDPMGPLNRIELLYLQELGVVSGDSVDPQTQPGSTALLDYMVPLLALGSSVTTYNPGGGITFEIADLAHYTHAMGFAHGGRAVINAWCPTFFPAVFCASITLQDKAEFYVKYSGQLDFAKPVPCGSAANPNLPLLANCNARDSWIDQTVAGYVESWESLGGDLHFAQNFRSQMGYDPTFSELNSGTQVIVDQRMQQSVELSGAFTTVATDPTDTVGGANQDFVAGRQTLEQAIETLSAAGTGGLFDEGNGHKSIGELVSQDVNGFFFSCLNCEVEGVYEHAFTPAKLDIYYQPYEAGWYVVPTVMHAAAN